MTPRQPRRLQEVFMGTTYLDRRQLLKGLGIGALTAGAAAALSPVTALAEGDPNSPLGAWNIDINPTGGKSRPAAVNFAAGGAFTTTDSLGPGAVGVGVWEGGRLFAFKFTVFDFSHGGVPVPVVISGHGAVSEGSIQGTASATVFGNFVGESTFSGGRMIV